MSKEISTSLRGRTITIENLPLSFKKYLNFKELDINTYTVKGISLINREFDEYLYWGGYPELVSFEKNFKLKILQEYLNVMIYRDLIEKYNIREVYILKYLIKKLFNAFTKEFSVNKIYNELKSRKFVISKNKLYDFMEYLVDNYVVSIVEKYEPSVVKKELSNKKIYLYDNGLFTANSISVEDNRGKLLENLIFIEIYRRYQKVLFLKNSFECDFLIFEDSKLIPIQVTYMLDLDNRKREINALFEVMKRFKLESGLLITRSEELDEEIKVDRKSVRIIPVIKWLLDL